MSEIGDLMDHVLNLELILKDMLQCSIDTSKRHIKKLKDFSHLNPDWNIYVAEQWKRIRENKEFIRRIYNE